MHYFYQKNNIGKLHCEGAEQGWGGAHFVKLPTFII